MKDEKNDDFIEIYLKYDIFHKLKIVYESKEYSYFDIFISCKKQNKLPKQIIDKISIDSFYINNKDFSYTIRIGIFKKDFKLYYILIKNSKKTIKYTSHTTDDTPIQNTLRKLLKV